MERSNMMFRKTLILLLSIGLIALLAGCGKDSTSSNSEDLNKIAAQFGGFTPTNELPYFGDPTLAAKLGGDKPYDDPIAAGEDSLVGDTGISLYAIRIVWGRLAYDSASTTPTDWTGSLKVSRGIEILRRTINFEPARDSILPRTDRSLIEWVSQTTVFHDGIFVNVFVPPADSSDTNTSPVTLTFDTAPFKITFNIDQLNGLDTVYYLSDSNAVAVQAFRFTWRYCPRGFLAGFWGTDDSGNGIFYGNWMTCNGKILGQVKGKWGIPDSTGEIQRVFVGKYIDINGRFEGLLKGDYGPMPNIHASEKAMCRAGGWFKGNFYDRDLNILGDLRGRYKSHPRDAAMGFFHGRWKVACRSIIGNDMGPDF